MSSRLLPLDLLDSSSEEDSDFKLDSRVALECTKRMKLDLVIILSLIGTCFCAPRAADVPIRIDLPVYDHPQPSSDELLQNSLKPENYPGGDAVRNKLVSGENIFTHKAQTASNLLENSLNAKAGGIFSAPVTTRETVLEETEGLGSKALSIKENIHAGVAGIFQPKPIVDTISESEKYGNTGDKFYNAGKAIVGGAENVANFVNSVLEIPGSIFKSITRAATEKLNNLGGKLIGL